MRYFWTVALIVLVVAGVAALHLTTTTSEYSRYNIQWNGTSAFFSTLEEKNAIEIRDLTSLKEYRNSVLLLIAPDRNFQKADIENYREYLRNNNTLILADDFGTGNQLLSGLGSGISIWQQRVSAVGGGYEDPSILKGVPCKDHSEVLFNRPAALRGGIPIIESPALSWLDANDDGHIDRTEETGCFTLSATEPLEGGEVIVIADPGIFINCMENEHFIEEILSTAPILLVDQTNTATASGDGMITLIQGIRENSIIKGMLALVTVLCVAYAFRRYHDN